VLILQRYGGLAKRRDVGVKIKEGGRGRTEERKKLRKDGVLRKTNEARMITNLRNNSS
jgi:hypothetical protein